MKKLFTFFLFIALSLMAACQTTTKEERLKTFLSKGNHEKIELKDGTTGETIEIHGKEKGGEFLSLFEDLKLFEVPDEKLKGYRYSVAIGDDQITFFGDEKIMINTHSYETNERIPMDKLKAYFTRQE